MRVFLVSLLALFVQTTSGLAAPVAETWFKYIDSQTQQYLILHQDESIWQLNLIEEKAQRLPRHLWKQTFSQREEALKLTRGWEVQSEISLPINPPTTTEVEGAHLWEVKAQWNWEWEKRFAQWVKNTISPNFTLEHNLYTDCADLAYVVRWIFARINGLPAVNHLAGSGVIFSQDSMKEEWLELPTAPDWDQDMRFLAALDYLMEVTFTHTLIQDTYPIAISSESLFEGALHMELNDVSGHTFIVNGVDPSEDSPLPLQVIFSTVPRALRALTEGGYWSAFQPVEGSGGFGRFLWPRITDRNWALEKAEAMPFYSTEQFGNFFVPEGQSFAEAVLLRLNPRMNFRERIREGIAHLLERFERRIEFVVVGFEFCRQNDCSKGTENYESWSTPSRDKQIMDLINQIEGAVSRDPELNALWEDALATPILTLEARTYELRQLIQIWKTHTYSSEPWDPIEARWGIRSRQIRNGTIRN